MSDTSRTVTLRYAVRVVVTLELRVSVPLDKNGNPVVEDWKIVKASETPTSSVACQDVTEAIAADDAEVEEFERLIREELAAIEGRD